MLSTSLDDSRLFYNFWEDISKRGFQTLAQRAMQRFRNLTTFDLDRSQFETDLLFAVLSSSKKGQDLISLCLAQTLKASVNLTCIPPEKPLPKGSRDISFLKDIPRFIESNRLSLGLAWLNSIVTHKNASSSLDIGTLNVCGLPEPIGSCGVKKDRFHEIGLKLKELKIVGLQEMWHSNCLEIIDSARFPYSIWDSAQRSSLTGGFVGRSGLAILSEYPIIEHNFLYFSETVGLERFVRKGALFARVKTPSGPIDLWNTHLVSEPERINKLLITKTQADSVRVRQLEELSHWISVRSKRGVPRIILGDFNIDESHDSYSLLKHLGAEDLYRLRLEKPGFTFDPSTNPFASSPSNLPERLDYIWSTIDLEQYSIGAERFLVSEPLSDHYGVKISLEQI